jgi:hypothetical protein
VENLPGRCNFATAEEFVPWMRASVELQTSATETNDLLKSVGEVTLRPSLRGTAISSESKAKSSF